MNKNKEYTKMILNRLNNKPNQPLKSNSNSNQKTQSTPTHHYASNDPKTFFEEFQTNCAVYHQPVILKTTRRPFVRPLYFELTEMQYKNAARMKQSQPPTRLFTQSAEVSQFVCQQPRKAISRSLYLQHKDYRCNAYKKSQEKVAKQSQNSQHVSRNHSLKTMPSFSASASSYISNIYNSHYGSHYPGSGISTSRRILIAQERKEWLPARNERRRLQPRQQLKKRCESFQKLYLERGI